MILLFLGVPLLVTILFTIKRVIDKTQLVGEIIYHVSFQTIISYVLFILIFLQGFMSHFYIIVILISIFLIVSLFYFLKENDLSFLLDGVMKLEGIKNNIIILLVTVIPLYVFMTILRYQPWYLQLLISFGLTAIVFASQLLISNTMERLFQNFITWFIDSDHVKYIFLWVALLVLLIASIFVRIPLNNVKVLTNLNNNARYWVFDKLPIDINNNFEQDIRAELILNSRLSNNIEDFYVLEDLLYLSYDNVIEIYSLTEEALIKTELLFYNLNENIDSESDSFSTKFIYHNEYLYFIDYSGFYLINGEDINKISHFSILNSNIFFTNDNSIRVLHSTLSKIYQIYEVYEEEITLIETVDVNLTDYQEMVVISNSLFFKDENNYRLYGDEEIIFENIFGEILFNHETKSMIFFDEDKLYINDGNKTIEKLDIVASRVVEGGAILDNIILKNRGKLEDERLLIFDNNMDNITLFNHLKTEAFIKDNDYSSKYISNYRELDSELAFLQIEMKDNETKLRVYNLKETPVDLELPFYSHFGIYFLLIIIIGIFIPITDDIKHVTYIDYVSKTNKKD